MRRPAVPGIVDQHVDEITALWNTRSVLTTSGHVALRHLARLDYRISANLDGAIIAGALGVALSREGLDNTNPGHVFAAALIPLEAGDRFAFDNCLAVVETVPESACGLRSALGWVDRARLSGAGRSLLESTSPFRQCVGLAACRLDNVDPGHILKTLLVDPDTGVRAEAQRIVGTLGCADHLPVPSALDDPHPECRMWAAWASVLLGERSKALDVLSAAALIPGLRRERAFRLSLQAMTSAAGHAFLQCIREDEAQRRWLIQGSGIVGDPAYVPWLISLMTEDEVATIAGESFTSITGADLPSLDLERKPPKNFESGPNDNAEDESVDMDSDESLPWPDASRVEEWWAANAHRFQNGHRYFIGAPVSREHCIEVLKVGYQRQRILAAHYLSLLEPGTPVFNTSAPAWRQRQWLAKMT